MKELDTMREAIEGLLEAANHNVGGMVPGVIASWCHKALAALSTIDLDAKPQEPSDNARIMAFNIRGRHHELDENGDWRDNWNLSLSQAAALITAHDDAIRRECDTSVQDTLTICGVHKDAGIRKAISTAILGTEPAREES